MNQTTYAYAWLYFDQYAANQVYNYCSSSISSFKKAFSSFNSYNAGLQFAFGSQSCVGHY